MYQNFRSKKKKKKYTYTFLDTLTVRPYIFRQCIKHKEASNKLTQRNFSSSTYTQIRFCNDSIVVSFFLLGSAPQYDIAEGVAQAHAAEKGGMNESKYNSTKFALKINVFRKRKFE